MRNYRRRAVVERCCGKGKTAEERFHMLARGWLAYPVTLVHAQLPPKSGCREMLRERKNRRRAVSHVSTGLACLPRDTGGMRNYRRRAVVERCCAEGTTASPGWLRFRRLNFPEIADAKFLAKIFSLIYTTALRRLPSPFD